MAELVQRKWKQNIGFITDEQEKDRIEKVAQLTSRYLGHPHLAYPRLLRDLNLMSQGSGTVSSFPLIIPAEKKKPAYAGVVLLNADPEPIVLNPLGNIWLQVLSITANAVLQAGKEVDLIGRGKTRNISLDGILLWDKVNGPLYLRVTKGSTILIIQAIDGLECSIPALNYPAAARTPSRPIRKPPLVTHRTVNGINTLADPPPRRTRGDW